MGETISIAVNAAVKSGPELRASWQADVDGYEKMDIQIDPAKTKTGTVPLVNAGEIQLLVVSVGASDGPVSYNFGSGGDVTLADGQLPRVLIYQKGMFLDTAASIAFTNGGQKPVTVDVLVGRKFNPPTPPAPPKT